jgi:hypothetical protein
MARHALAWAHFPSRCLWYSETERRSAFASRPCAEFTW